MKKIMSLLLSFVLIFTCVPPSFASSSVARTNQKLTVNGQAVTCDIYNIGGNNYFKLRDLAYLLNGTGSQFSVGYNEVTSTVSIISGAVYTPLGSELQIGKDLSSTAHPSTQPLYIDGVLHTSLTAYNIGGNNFFKLRDLGTALGFGVDYDAPTSTMIVTSADKSSPAPHIWERRYYVDNFKQETKNWYITNFDYFEGTFSNSAIKDALLYAAVNVDEYGYVGIVLNEYSNMRVYNYNPNDDAIYKITVRTPNGEDLFVTGRMYAAGGGTVFIDDEYNDAVFKALQTNARVGFYLEYSPASSITNSYLFWVECGDFADVFSASYNS